MGPISSHDTYTRHHREQLLGTPLLVRSAVLAADADGVDIHHELVPANAEALAATFVHRVSPTETGGRRLPVPRRPSRRCDAAAIAPLPYAAPRTIDLAVGPLALAPPLEVVRERDLAVRKPRTISVDECDERGGYRPDMTMMLLWGGEPPDDTTGWGPELYEGPDGELMGWAVMETRVQLDRLPTAGTRIQSFGATIAHPRAGDPSDPLVLRPRPRRGDVRLRGRRCRVRHADASNHGHPRRLPSPARSGAPPRPGRPPYC